jgi:protein-S-isoprenylcysteine O-methyltransferase Ste14
MNESTFHLIVGVWTSIGILTFLYLLKTTAPYGRHTSEAWGPMIDNRLGWFIMEFPVLIFLFAFLGSAITSLSAPVYVMLGLFTFHYINRSIIFPLRTRTTGKKMPLIIALSAIGFNFMNGFQNGWYFAKYAEYTSDWFSDPRFIVGLTVFFTGMAINWWADNRLIHLRKPGETGYVIPQGGFFNYISCPNLFGEMVEWLGFAIMLWNLPGLSFFIWTAANLIPRALSHHKWYTSKFPEYPANRKAVIPGIL